MRGSTAIFRNELRLLRHDPVPAVVLVGIPLVLMSLLSTALALALAAQGYARAPGSAQTVPGMACVFALFGAGLVGFALFREHGWHTWPRLRSAGIGSGDVLVGKLLVPGLLLVAQGIVLFGVGVLFLELEVSGSWLAVGAVNAAYIALVLLAGLAVAAALQTVQQLNAVIYLAAMVLGCLGGAFVPVETLPEVVQPIAPISPAYWAMEGYRTAILGGGGLGDVLGEIGMLGAFAAVCAVVAIWRLRLDAPKRTWG